MLEMKDYSVNFTIVLDEYGSTAGLITFLNTFLLSGISALFSLISIFAITFCF